MKPIKAKIKNAKKNKTNKKKSQELALDEALKETFPASDAVAKY